MLYETGVWPVEWKVGYQKLMLLQMLLDSEEDRQARRILEEQEKEGKEYGFYHECQKICDKIAVEIREVREMKKESWKKRVKQGIEMEIRAKHKVNRVQKKKLRHGGESKRTWQAAKYLRETGVSKAAEIMRTRTEMWDIGRNQGKDRKCKGCKTEESTEHIINCWEVKIRLGEEVKEEWLREETIQPLRKVTRYIKKYMEWRNNED